MGKSRMTVLDVKASVASLRNQLLGARVAKAVDDLDAPHLRPTSIRKRLDEGVDASCHSLVALLANVVTRDP